MAANRIVSLVYSVLCLFALTYHVGKISSKYFRYETLTNLQMNAPKQVAPPGFSLCIRYTEFLRGRNLKYSIWTESKEEQYYRNVTVRQIFNNTPPGDQLFAECKIREPRSYIVRRYLTNQCLKYFDILKYYVQEYICYRFSPTMNGTIDFGRISSAFTYSTMAYEIGLPLKLFNVTLMFRGIVHSTDVLPFVSIQYSPEFSRKRPLAYNYYRFTGIQVNNRLLQPPYSSQCITNHDGNQGIEDCYKECIVTKTLARWRMFPFTEIITENEPVYNLNFTHLTTFDLIHNETLAHEYDTIETQCEYRCRFPYCDNTVTVTQMFERSLREDALVFRIDLPRSFTYDITSLPSMEIVDYVTYVLSCFGTWLGLSAINFDPVQIWRQIKRRTKVNKQSRPNQLFEVVKPSRKLNSPNGFQ